MLLDAVGVHQVPRGWAAIGVLAAHGDKKAVHMLSMLFVPQYRAAHNKQPLEDKPEPVDPKLAEDVEAARKLLGKSGEA